MRFETSLLYGLAIGLFLTVAPLAPADEPISLHTVHFPPYEVEDSEDLPGFDVETIREAFRRSNIAVEIRFTPWKRALLMAEAGSIAGVFSCSFSKKRDHFIAVSDPISTLTPVIALNPGIPEGSVRKLTDITSLRVIGLRGYSYEQELTDLNIPHTVLTTDEQALKQIALNRADALYTGLENAAYLAKQLGLSGKIRFAGLEDREITLFRVCFSKNRPGYDRYLSAFNQALHHMRADGTLKRIQDRYR